MEPDHSAGDAPSDSDPENVSSDKRANLNGKTKYILEVWPLVFKICVQQFDCDPLSNSIVADFWNGRRIDGRLQTNARLGLYT